MEVDKLISYTQDVMNCCCKDKYYGSVFFHSNENLKGVFDQVDVAGKDVLTVLSSGDQALHLYDRGAKSVELFDINNLTIYYYYLRVWTIKYLNQYYPDVFFKNNFLERVLVHVKPTTKEEEIAYLYWKKFIWYFKDYGEDDLDELFLLGFDIERNIISDLSKVKQRLNNEKYVFYNIDLSKNVNLDKKYDVIFVSNIGDKIRGLISDDKGVKRLQIYEKNLLNLLNDNGIVIATNVVRNRRTSDEARIFDNDFEFYPMDKVNCRGYQRSPGYYYKKIK